MSCSESKCVADHTIDVVITDLLEKYVEDSSDDDFQPVLTSRKRRSRENTPQRGPQKKLKGKEKEKAQESIISTPVSTADKLKMLNTITLDDYDLESSSDDFDTPIVKRPKLGESSISAFHRTSLSSAAAESSTSASKKTSLTSLKPSKPIPDAFKPIAIASVKTAPFPVSVERVSDTTKEGPEKPCKRVMTIKATIKYIWRPAYLQPLCGLAHTINLLVTHNFSFTKYIYLQELVANENFALNGPVTKDFFVEVFLSLVLAKAGNSKRLKDTTKEYRRLISKYKEAYFEDAGYTLIIVPYAQQVALYECTKIQAAYFNNIMAHFGNRLRAWINKLFNKKEKVENLKKEMQATYITEIRS
ncbi:hypothetical protein RMATCC62417_14366 [Rhizopus microsporus]|nr:hypothetical protein RMATCC62417_14366 [Rhizopus microsporus]